MENQPLPTSDQVSVTAPPPPEPASVSSKEFDELVRSRRPAAPPPGPKKLDDEIFQRVLDNIPPEPTPEEAEAQRRRDERAAYQRQLAEREARVQSLFSERGKRYAGCTLANYTCQTDAQKAAVAKLVAYAKELDQRVRTGEGIVLFGPAGTGKDHLLAAMMRAAITTYGKTVRWENGMDLFGDIRDRMDQDKSESDLIRSLCYPDVLAISDPLPPFGPLTPFQANMLFRVIDGRYSAGKPTWVTLNCASGEEAEARMGVQMVDRLRHGALSIFTNWPSYRSQE